MSPLYIHLSTQPSWAAASSGLNCAGFSDSKPSALCRTHAGRNPERSKAQGSPSPCLGSHGGHHDPSITQGAAGGRMDRKNWPSSASVLGRSHREVTPWAGDAQQNPKPLPRHTHNSSRRGLLPRAEQAAGII